MRETADNIVAKRLKILMLEDSAEDVALIERELKKAGLLFETTVVDGRDEFANALEAVKPDVILSDHSLPSFNSVEALKLFKAAQAKFHLFAPFILVTGAVSEEFAVQCIKEGANDYILKDRLRRLPASILSALEKTRLDSERIRFFNEVVANEAMLRQAQSMAHLGSWQTDLISGESQWSDETFRLLGYEPGEIQPDFDAFKAHIHSEDLPWLLSALDDALANLSEYENEFRIVRKDGEERHINFKFIIERDPQNEPSRLQGFLLDITQQKNYVAKIEAQNKKFKEIAWIQSHEVRAPLARTLGLVNLIILSNKKNEDTGQLLTYLTQSVEDLDILVRTVVRKTEEISDL